MKQAVSAMKTECVMKKWSVQAGASVKKGDLLCTVTSGKMNREVTSPFNGEVLEILIPEGEKIPGGAPICNMEAEEGAAAAGGLAAGEEVAVKMPKVSGGATVKKWNKAVGDTVKVGEVLLSVAAGKMNTDVVCRFGGELIRIDVAEGAEVKTGDAVAMIRSDGTGSLEEEGEGSTKVIVVGGGPGGYVAAIRAAQLGAEVTLIEKNIMGGTCLNMGCIPTKALLHSAEVYATAKNGAKCGIEANDVTINWAQVQNNRVAISKQLSGGVEGLLAANGVDVVNGMASFKDEKTLEVVLTSGEKTEMTADKIILATGSSPFMPPIPGIENPNCIDSTGALTLEQLPASMVIIGGGVIGIELACTYALFGTKVTIVEMMDRIMPVMDYELTLVAQKMMEEKGIEFCLETQVLRFEESPVGAKVVTKLKSGEEKIFEAEKVLVAVGRRSNIAGLNLEAAGIETERGHIVANDKLETNVAGVYAIGDCVGKIMLAHTASTMGEIAAENAMGKNHKYNEKVCPSCVYMVPEFAYVGMNEEQAKAKGLNYKVGKFPLAANGKSLIMEETGGWIKIVTDSGGNRILGVHILGARATDIIAEAAMAMKMGATVGDVINTIHAHPTVAEAMKEAAMAVQGRAIHFK